MVTTDKELTKEWFDTAEVGMSTPGERAYHRLADKLKRKRGQNIVGKSVKLANNTYVYIRDGYLAVRLHQTDILLIWPSGNMRIDTNGWQTVTTKDRLNAWIPAPYSIYQENRVWYFVDSSRNPLGKVESPRYLCQDGMSVSSEGLVEGAELYDREAIKRVNRLKKQIKGYAKDYAQALADGKVPAPSSSDCWYCLFLEEVSKDTTHLISHMSKDEKYYVPSILQLAMEQFPVSQALQWYVAHYWTDTGDNIFELKFNMQETVEQLVTRYMYRRLGFAG